MASNTTLADVTCDINELLRNYHQRCNGAGDFHDFDECPVAPEFLAEHGAADGIESDRFERMMHGLGATAIVTVCTIFGAFILPVFQNKERLFGQIMLFLTALAVSALSGAALMVLIPEGLGLQDCAKFQESNLSVCAGILMFFIIRRALHFFTGHDDCFTTDLKAGKEARSRTATVINDKEAHILIDCNECDDSGKCPQPDSSSSVSSPTPTSNSQCALKKKKALDSIKSMKSVGWMTLLGDSAHNFLDGIALGATFHHPGSTEKAISKGWQITVAVLAEEFPHELGDFAVLLRSGLTVWEAIACNLVSGMTCLLGYFVGMFYGEDLGLYVFSWMGGVFLFISLGCMLPEVEATITDLNSKFNQGNKNQALLIQFKVIAVLGFISGYAIVYCAGKYMP